MITLEHSKEALSRTYVSAVAFKVRSNLELKVDGSRKLDYGVDGSFVEVRKYRDKFNESGLRVDFQLKSTVRWERTADGRFISYNLDADEYNDLARRTARYRIGKGALKLLILYCMPGEEAQYAF